ncbi:MAG: septum formation inhibitor Maf [Oscillospiraceae bacterium]|nr:septum formation inhibitor Maf [Oscillospiraceae bacterium]
MMALILASQSPRRKVLMGFITTSFTVDVPTEEEKVEPGTPADEMVQTLALKKAQAVAKRHPGDIVIGCDTVVAVDGEILGKPKSEDDAAAMLHKLSGKEHHVYTGVALVQDDREECFVSATGVKFYDLEEELIEWYVGTGEPADKAGAYGIQGNGSILVERLDGDYFTVMGLPVGRLYRELKKFSAQD